LFIIVSTIFKSYVYGIRAFTRAAASTPTIVAVKISQSKTERSPLVPRSHVWREIDGADDIEKEIEISSCSMPIGNGVHEPCW
jgi:hypothetical protein